MAYTVTVLFDHMLVDETPYYYQNEVVTKQPLKEVLKLIYEWIGKEGSK